MRHIDQKKTTFPEVTLILIRCVLCGAFLACSVLFASPSALAAPDKTMIYFYSSETNINNFKSLKMEFDTYLSGLGPYALQPFSDRSAFENHVRDKTECLLVLSSWHYANIYKEYKLIPALVGMKDGKNYQKRIWVGRSGTTDIASVKSGRVASASSVRHTQSSLGEILGKEGGGSPLKILTVPKDIDALMSVGFGMAKSALTTTSALDNLKKINPVLHRKIAVLADGKESLLLILAFPEGFAGKAEAMLKLVEDMPASPEGEKRIRMLGLDGWQKLSPTERARLEGKQE